MEIAFVVLWLGIGMVFWIYCLVYSGMPNSWSSQPREAGAAEVVFFWLPFCMVCGPILWMLLGYFRGRA